MCPFTLHRIGVDVDINFMEAASANMVCTLMVVHWLLSPQKRETDRHSKNPRRELMEGAVWAIVHSPRSC